MKRLLKKKREDLNQDLVAFIHTLLEDIKDYKTLPTYTLRRLKISKKESNFDDLIKDIETLRGKLGDDYLNMISRRVKDIENDIIIAVGNTKD